MALHDQDIQAAFQGANPQELSGSTEGYFNETTAQAALFQQEKPMSGKYEEVQLYRYENGKKIVNLCFNESGDDWIRAGRLSEEAKAGDKESARELERMDKGRMLKAVEK